MIQRGPELHVPLAADLAMCTLPGDVGIGSMKDDAGLKESWGAAGRGQERLLAKVHPK